MRLEEFFKAAEKWHKYRADFENWQEEFRDWQRQGSKGTAPEAPSEPTSPKATIEEVLTPVLIRRRRRDIKEIYGESAVIAGKPVRFPEPVLENLEYRLDRVYAKVGSFDEMSQRLRKHKAARYRATDYLTDEARDRPE